MDTYAHTHVHTHTHTHAHTHTRTHTHTHTHTHTLTQTKVRMKVTSGNQALAWFKKNMYDLKDENTLNDQSGKFFTIDWVYPGIPKLICCVLHCAHVLL